MDLSKNEKKLLMNINNEKYIAMLAKECIIGHSNAVVVCRKLYNKHLIFFKRVKNRKYVMLTEQGQDVKELLFKLNQEVGKH